MPRIATILANKALGTLSGIIVLWSGAIDDIPDGWLLCDGTQGTPDLILKFIPCAGLAYNPGDTAHITHHTHVFVTDGHTHRLHGGGIIFRNEPYGQISTSTSQSSMPGITDFAFHIPPYKAFCYIKKI